MCIRIYQCFRGNLHSMVTDKNIGSASWFARGRMQWRDLSLHIAAHVNLKRINWEAVAVVVIAISILPFDKPQCLLSSIAAGLRYRKAYFPPPFVFLH